MRVSKGAIVRAFSTGQVPAKPYVRGSSNRNENEHSALDHAEGVRQCFRWLQWDADAIVQAAPDHPVRDLRNMKGLQPYAFI
jgi:hypothetical protein